MTTHRLALTIGTAGAGMLAAAFLPMAIAQADGADAAAAVAAPAPTDSISYVIAGPEQITSISGMAPFDQQTSGYQLLDINDTTLGTTAAPVTLGTVETLENSSINDSGFTNAESLVTNVTLGDYPAADLPTTIPVDGTISDVYQYAASPSLFTNVYTEIPGVDGAAPTATDTLTLFGLTLPAFSENFLASLAFPNADMTFGPFLTELFPFLSSI